MDLVIGQITSLNPAVTTDIVNQSQSLQQIKLDLAPIVQNSPTQSTVQPTILSKSVLLNFGISVFGISKKIASTEIVEAVDNKKLASKDNQEQEEMEFEEPTEKEKADKKNKINPNVISVSKSIIESATLKAISKFDSETRNLVFALCLPSLVKKGIFLVPIPHIEKVNDLFIARNIIRNTMIDKFITEYIALTQTDEGIASLEERLGKLYDPNNYPNPHKVRAAFDMTWSFITFETPESLKSVRGDIFKTEQEKAAKRWLEVTDDLQDLMRAQSLEIVEHMVDRLTPDVNKPDKPKMFKATFVENAKQFLETFDVRNIVNDVELSNALIKAKKVIAGVDPNLLRSDALLREKVLQGFSEAKKLMDSMVISKKRAFDFVEES